jgi:hypothetical protein
MPIRARVSKMDPRFRGDDKFLQNQPAEFYCTVKCITVLDVNVSPGFSTVDGKFA